MTQIGHRVYYIVVVLRLHVFVLAVLALKYQMKFVVCSSHVCLCVSIIYVGVAPPSPYFHYHLLVLNVAMLWVCTGVCVNALIFFVKLHRESSVLPFPYTCIQYSAVLHISTRVVSISTSARVFGLVFLYVLHSRDVLT